MKTLERLKCYELLDSVVPPALEYCDEFECPKCKATLNIMYHYDSEGDSYDYLEEIRTATAPIENVKPIEITLHFQEQYDIAHGLDGLTLQEAILYITELYETAEKLHLGYKKYTLVTDFEYGYTSHHIPGTKFKADTEI